MITYNDIHNQVDIAVKANGTELADGIDVDAITAEIIERYGLVAIDAKVTEDDDETVIPFDEFWDIVRRHDSTQV